jgi:purine-binding chemotaxis protein CheW
MTAIAAHEPAPTPARPAGDDAAILLVFRIEGEAFGLSVDPVHEILDPPEITPVPNAGPFAPGLVNVRGVVVPVLDIRHRLRMPPGMPGPAARIIVLEHEIEGVRCRLSFVADAVDDVIEIHASAVDRMPEIGARWPPACIAGAIRHGEDLVVLLEPEALFAPDTAEIAA